MNVRRFAPIVASYNNKGRSVKLRIGGQLDKNTQLATKFSQSTTNTYLDIIVGPIIFKDRFSLSA